MCIFGSNSDNMIYTRFSKLQEEPLSSADNYLILLPIRGHVLSRDLILMNTVCCTYKVQLFLCK